MILLKNDEFSIAVDKLGSSSQRRDDWGGYSQRILSVVGGRNSHSPRRQNNDYRKRKRLNRMPSFSGCADGNSIFHGWKERLKEKQRTNLESPLPQRKKRRVDYRSGLDYLTQKFNCTFKKENTKDQGNWKHADMIDDENDTDEEYVMPLALYRPEFLDSSSLLEDDMELKTTADCHSLLSEQSAMELGSELSTGKNDEFPDSRVASQSQTTASSMPVELPEGQCMSPFLESNDLHSQKDENETATKLSNQLTNSGPSSRIESYNVPTFNPAKDESLKLPLTINNPEFFESLKMNKDKENKNVKPIQLAARSSSGHTSDPSVRPQGSIKFHTSAKLIVYSKYERTKANIKNQKNSTIISMPNSTTSPKSILKNSINAYAQAENVRARHCDLVHVDDFIELFETHEQNRINSEPFLSQIRQNQVQSYYNNIS